MTAKKSKYTAFKISDIDSCIINVDPIDDGPRDDQEIVSMESIKEILKKMDKNRRNNRYNKNYIVFDHMCRNDTDEAIIQKHIR